MDVTEPFNVYISGIDVDGPITTNSRSDVNLIMTVNPQTKKILLTTTPRDYYVTIPEVSGEERQAYTCRYLWRGQIHGNLREPVRNRHQLLCKN